MTYPLELQLRLLIREHLLAESGPAPATDSFEVYRVVNDAINTFEWFLAAADIVVIGSVAASGGALSLPAAMYLKAAGLLGGVLNIGQAAIYFTDPKGPFIVRGCMEIFEGIVSLLTTPATARMAAAGVRLGWRVLTELTPVILQVLTWITEKLFPGLDPHDDIKKELAKAVADFLKTKAPSVPPGVDIGQLVQELAIDDSASGLPGARRTQVDVDTQVQQETGLPTNVISNMSDDLYVLYTAAFDSVDSDSGANLPAAPPAPKQKPINKKPAVAGMERKVAELTKLPDPDAFIRDYKYDSQNGDLRWMGDDPYMGSVVGNLYTMKPGDTIPPTGRIKLVGIEIESSGTSIEKVVVKGPTGEFFKVRSMYS